MGTNLRRLGRVRVSHGRRGEPPTRRITLRQIEPTETPSPQQKTQDFSLVYARGPDLHALRRHDRVEPDLEVADRLVDVHELVQAEQADAERVVVVRLAEHERHARRDLELRVLEVARVRGVVVRVNDGYARRLPALGGDGRVALVLEHLAHTHAQIPRRLLGLLEAELLGLVDDVSEDFDSVRRHGGVVHVAAVAVGAHDGFPFVQVDGEGRGPVRTSTSELGYSEMSLHAIEPTRSPGRHRDEREEQ